MKNRLGSEKSPYLVQHKDNPVWWYAWTPEAFEEAKKQNKPIFLSIGYSTCHWCHVMEKESFESQALADILNKHFISIKVDREERPEIDDLYMKVVQQISGHGGWPMSVWLTPELKPFFGGTYFKPEHFEKLLLRIHEVWSKEPKKLIEDSEKTFQMLQAVSKSYSTEKKFDPSKAFYILQDFYKEMMHRYEPEKGGFSQAPKFPSGLGLMTLMRIYRRVKDPLTEKRLKNAIRHSLDSMSRGGIYDQLSGGFHRYSVDEKWLVPHFEKMLYDNALLAQCYLDAYQLFGVKEYAVIVRETLDFILSEMTSPEGGFYCAQDADSLNPNTGKKEEGYFCTFSYSEVVKEMTEEELKVSQRVYGLCQEGHYEGRNVIHLKDGATREDKESTHLKSARLNLKRLRSQRPVPHLDDKILTDWNALVISVMAKASWVLGEEKYLSAAQKAKQFVCSRLCQKEVLYHRYRDGEVKVSAFSEDYANLISASLNMYEATFDEVYVLRAIKFQAEMDRNFWDSQTGGYFKTDGKDTSVLVRLKDDYDGVMPCASSQAALNLLKLYHLTFDEKYLKKAENIFSAYQERLQKYPSSLSVMVSALDMYQDHCKQIAIIAPQREVPHIYESLRTFYLPNMMIAVASKTGSQIPLLQDKKISDKMQVYICEDRTCQPPKTDWLEVIATLNDKVWLDIKN